MSEENVNPEYDNRAISVYGASSDAMDDFPVLKAFQQYIDAEQAKARKRMLTMGIFFGVAMFIVVAIFVALLVSVSNRNQALNDRLVEFAMRERSGGGSSVVVQQPQDTSAMLTLTSKFEEMQKKISEAEKKASAAIAEAEEKARRAQVAAEASKPKPPTAEELEIKRLNALLAAEKEKASAEKERKHQEELEAYRRKHYPELYQTTKKVVKAPSRRKRSIDDILDELDARAEEELDDEALDDEAEEALKPVSYFDEDEEETSHPVRKTKVRTTKAKRAAEEKESRSISVKNGDSSASWAIPD